MTSSNAGSHLSSQSHCHGLSSRHTVSTNSKPSPLQFIFLTSSRMAFPKMNYANC
jgi:hypothetical protein